MKAQLITAGLALMMLTALAPARAAMRSVNKIRAGIPPYEVVRDVTKTNAAASGRQNDGRSRYAPYMTWLTDPSPAIRPALVVPPGKEVYTVRNLGALLENNAAAVDYGVRTLLTPVLLITVDTGNDAVRRYLQGLAGVSPALRRTLSALHAALPDVKPLAEPSVELMRKCVEADVDFQVSVAVRRYRDRVRAGRVVVVGSVLDVENVYGRGRARLIIINVNGETNDDRLRRHQALKRVGPKLARIHIGRAITRTGEHGKAKRKPSRR